MNLQPLTKILRQIADLQQKLTFQAIWKVLIFSLEMTTAKSREVARGLGSRLPSR